MHLCYIINWNKYTSTRCMTVDDGYIKASDDIDNRILNEKY